jgi:hypothetical protein
MTILEFIRTQKPQGINEWLALISASGFMQHEKLILLCAEENNLILINHNATFEGVVK